MHLLLALRFGIFIKAADFSNSQINRFSGNNDHNCFIGRKIAQFIILEQVKNFFSELT